MLIEGYLNKRILKRTIVIAFSLLLVVFTQGIVTFLHEVEWDYIQPQDFLLLSLKEGLPTVPIILNLSLVIAWMTIKKELYQKKEVHALWLSGWTSQSSIRLIIKNLLLLSSINIFILFILSPSLRNVGPVTQADWIRSLAGQNLRHPITLSPAKHIVIKGERVQNRQIFSPLLIDFEEDWAILSGTFATFSQNTIDISSIKKEYGFDEEGESKAFSINQASIPILEDAPIFMKESWSANELYESSSPKYKGELIWRLALIVLPWIVLLPFHKLSPTIQYRNKDNGTGEYSLCLLWFSMLLIFSFFLSKLPILIK